MLRIPFILFISGVSGAGKTTILRKLCQQLSPKTTQCFHFDSIGIPTIDEMIEKYGSPSEWQYAMTEVWVNRLLTEYRDKPLLILEGQINLKFIEEICAKHNFKNYRINCEKEAYNKSKNEEIFLKDIYDNFSISKKEKSVFTNDAIDALKINKEIRS